MTKMMDETCFFFGGRGGGGGGVQDALPECSCKQRITVALFVMASKANSYLEVRGPKVFKEVFGKYVLPADVLLVNRRHG